MTGKRFRRWLTAGALALALSSCGPAKESGTGAGGGGGVSTPPPDAARYEWVIQAREAEATDPKSVPDVLARAGSEALPFLVWQLTGSTRRRR